MRLTLRLAAIAGGLLVCLPLHYLWRLLGRRSPWPPRFLFWVGYAAGLRVRILGTPLRRDVLIAANHLTWLDIMVLGGATGAAFGSRDEVARWPVVGWLAGLNDTIYVARSERREIHSQAKALREALASGRPVALFPEGTTEGGDVVLPFRPSLFAALFPPLPNLKVQPVAVDYGTAAAEIAWVGEEPVGANAKRVLSRRGTTPVVLHFLEPVDPETAGDRKAVAAIARAEIVEALGGSSGASEPSPHSLYASR